MFFDAGCADGAESYWNRVRTYGFCPGALYNLGKLAFERNEHDEARCLMLAALDMTREPLDGVNALLEYVPSVLRGLRDVNGAPCICENWNVEIALPTASGVSMPDASKPRMLLSVRAPSHEAAATYVDELYTAMQPGSSLAADQVVWKSDAGKSKEDPVSPGILGCRFVHPAREIRQ